MNHIYKVIWNHAKHCYTVVSEIAKNHSTSSVSKKSASAVLLAVTVLLSGGVSVYANNLAPDISKIAIGQDATATGQNGVAIGSKTEASGLDSIAIGGNTKATGTDSIAIGDDTTANSYGSVAIGDDIHFTGESATAVGQQAHATSINSTAIGAMTNVDADYNFENKSWRIAGKQSTAIGAYSGSWGDNSTAVGAGAKADGKSSIAVGFFSKVTAKNAVALGSYAKADGGFSTAVGYASEVTAGEAVALGDWSKASREAGWVGYDPITGEKSLDESSTWKATKGAVSIGNGDQKYTRQITNVAAGTEDTDAVNVAQLKQVASHQGWYLSTNGMATAATKVAGDFVDFSGDDNVSVSNEETKVKVALNKDVKLHSATFGDTVINAEGLTIGNGTSGLEFSKNRVSVGGQQIHDVAAGKDDMDAVNVSQLKGVENIANKGWNLSTNGVATAATNVAPGDYVDFSGDDNVSVSNEETKVKVALNKDVKLHSATFGDTVINAEGLTIGNGTSGLEFSKNRVSVGGQQIHDVAAGKDDMDAVNVSQLKGVENKVDKNAENIQKNTEAIAKNTADISKNAEAISKNTENIQKNSDAIAKNAENIQKNTEAIAKNTADISKNTEAIGKLDERVTSVEEVAKKHTTVSTDDKNVQISEDTNTDGGKDYKVSLNKNLKLDSVTTGDTKMDTNGVTVKDVSLTKDGLSIGNKTYVSNKGLNANDQKVTNVAAGDISEKSTDAVNGSQLFATNQQVAQNARSINKLGNRINKVGAGAAALAALHPLDFDPDDKWDFAAGYGNYNGENAAAIGAYYRPNEDTMFSVGGSFGNGENMVNAGISLKLGQGNHVSTSKVAMAKEIKDLRKELEGLKSALLDVNAGKKVDTSKLQLFPDVPKNHWAYEYVSTLKGNGALTGYPDGEFKGDRPMTRYEFATMLYKAMLEGATLSDKILKEFAPELEHFTVDTVHQDKDGKPTVERVRTVKAEK